MRKIAVEFIKPIPRETRKHILAMVEMVRSEFDVQDDMLIRVTPSYVVGDGKDGYGFAAFVVNKGDVKIYLAGHQVPDMTYSEWLEVLMESLCHELAHYEQYRDGKEIQERGVAVRTKSIMRRLGW